MNKLNLTHEAGYPFDVNFLAFMQNAYSLFNHLGHLAGNLAIISGCEQTGNTIAAGTVFINGELLPFEGGAKSDSIFIKEVTNEVTFEDGFLRPLETIRTATFGRSTPEKTFNWADFQRVTNLQDLGENKAEKQALKDLKDEVEKLKKQKQAVPIGLIALWGRPASEIPAGWREYVNLRGKMPVGLDPDYVKTKDDSQDYQLNTILKAGGERSHKLTLEEMPKHHHQQGSLGMLSDYGGGDYIGDRGWGTIEPYVRSYSHQNTSSVGGDQPHNNMPPYRVVQFIEYVGF
ncbi:phage baseplate protein [Capnocytophaga ochracea]